MTCSDCPTACTGKIDLQMIYKCCSPCSINNARTHILNMTRTFIHPLPRGQQRATRQATKQHQSHTAAQSFLSVVKMSTCQENITTFETTCRLMQLVSHQQFDGRVAGSCCIASPLLSPKSSRHQELPELSNATQQQHLIYQML